MTTKKIDWPLFLIYLVIMILVLIASSCNMEKQAIKFYALHPEKFAQKCADAFPVNERVVPGKPEVRTDTVYQKPDSVPCPDGKKVPCPACKSKNTYTTVRDTVFRENTAKVASLDLQLRDQGKQLVDLQALSHEKDLKLKDKDAQIAKLKTKVFNRTALLALAGLLLAGAGFFIVKNYLKFFI